MVSRMLKVVLLLGALFAFAPSASAEAEAGAGEATGLEAGATVPRFMLPVVNEYEAKKWGPNKWVGQGADQGKKLVVMSFFATYCEPCKKEMPELVRLYESYKDQGLGVMLVSIDRGQDSGEVVTLAKENNVTFPVVHDRFQVVARRYKAERLPYMLMVGPDGVVKTVHVGYTEELKQSLENEIRTHLELAPLPSEKAADKKPPPNDGKKKPAQKGKGKGKSKKG